MTIENNTQLTTDLLPVSLSASEIALRESISHDDSDLLTFTVSKKAIRAIHSSFTGLGGADKLPEHYELHQTSEGLQVWFDGVVIKMPDIEQQIARWTYLDFRDLSSRPTETLERFAERALTGSIAVNHNPQGTHPTGDALTPHKTLLDSIGVTSTARNGKGSKMYLIYLPTVTKSIKLQLESAGFSNISPLLDDDFDVIGLKLEPPKPVDTVTE